MITRLKVKRTLSNIDILITFLPIIIYFINEKLFIPAVVFYFMVRIVTYKLAESDTAIDIIRFITEFYKEIVKGKQ